MDRSLPAHAVRAFSQQAALFALLKSGVPTAGAETAWRAITEAAQEAQHGQCLWPAVDDVAGEPQRVARRIVTLGDAAYPAPLLHNPDPPLLLYLQGDAALLSSPCIILVSVMASSRMPRAWSSAAFTGLRKRSSRLGVMGSNLGGLLASIHGPGVSRLSGSVESQCCTMRTAPMPSIAQ